MTGRFFVETAAGKLLFEISHKGAGMDVSVLHMEMGMNFNPRRVEQDGDTLILMSVFFMAPKVVHTLKMTYCAGEDGGDGYYELSGSYAAAGPLNCRALPFKGKTRYDVMMEELPSVRTHKTVYRTDAEIAALVDELMAQMTLEEKIGQMSQSAGNNTAAIGGAITQTMSTEEMIERGMLGSAIAMGGPENIYALQKVAVEKSRLHIPMMFCQDVIHGYQTIFPIPLGWSCSFDPELVQKAARVAAREVTTKGIMYAFAPMLDIARDPRWGRVSEGNGEDPYLDARMCEAMVRGYQGEDLADDDTMMACLKHFVGYSAAEGGRDYNTCEITETTLRNVYLPPFEAGIDTGAASVMNAFNTMNGVPVAVNKYILRDVLREELGFDGVLVSDYSAVEEAIAHGAAEDGKDAACKAVRASMDIEMASSLYNNWLKEAVEKGELDEALIDESTRRILTYKYKTGLMDDPFKYIQPENEDRIFCQEHREIARELARESIVLLKNDVPVAAACDAPENIAAGSNMAASIVGRPVAPVLPLFKSAKVALIGPKGDSTDMLGPWQFSQKSNETVTIRQGLEAKGVQVICEMGCDIDEAIEGGIERAVEAAKEADVIILALGESMGMSGEAASRQSITVPQVQMALAEAVVGLHKPTVAVLTNGRPLIVEWFMEHVDALVEAWFPGSEAGNALADILTGDYNPSGKLSISFPRHQGQIPIYYNHFSTGRPYKDGMNKKFLSRYIDGPNAPRFTFGYGLSYTSFAVENLRLSAESMSSADTMTATVDVTNTGDREGTQVVQLYIHDVAASIARPVKELKGFKRVNLAPGECREVVFELNKDTLSFFNAANEKVTEPGKFEIFVGSSSDDGDLLKAEMVYLG